MLNEVGFHKLAFWAVAPLKVKDKKEWKTSKGYAKEWVNRLLAQSLGTLPGTVVLGAGVAAKSPALQALGLLGAVAGGVTGNVRSLRKTERKAGVKRTGFGQYLGRGLGAGVGRAVVPFVGGPLVDYLVSRKMQEH